MAATVTAVGRMPQSKAKSGREVDQAIREGAVFRRCGCGATTKRDRCPSCGRKEPPWRFKIDIGVEGGRRKTRSGTFRTRAEAVAALQAIQHLQSVGEYVDRSRITTRAYIEPWLDRVAPNLSPATHDNYLRYWRRLNPYLGHIRLQGLTRDDVILAYAALKEADLADSTIHGHH